jgi:hypothetical protein
MGVLTARFDINLKMFPGYLIGEAETSTFYAVFQVGHFKAEVEMGSSNVPSMGHADSVIKRFFFDRLVVSLSNETASVDMARFGQDFLFYRSTLAEFQSGLLEAINRVIAYFKFRLRNPLLRLWTHHELLRDERGCFGPSWFLNGQDVTPNFGDCGKMAGVVAIQGWRFLNQYGFGVEKLTPQLHRDLEAFLQEPKEPRLFDQLLSDAQSAIVDVNVRRSVLELAIAVEVLVKNTFSVVDAAAAELKIEGMGGKTVGVLYLLSKASKMAFGESFKESAPQEFADLDALFRTRNSIAHRGECQYRRDNGETVVVTGAELKVWWTSALSMAQWLEARSMVVTS